MHLASTRKLMSGSSLISLALAISALTPATAANTAAHMEDGDLDRNGEQILVVRTTTSSPAKANELAQFILNNYGKPDYIIAPGNYRYVNSTVGPLSRLTGVRINAMHNDWRTLGHNLVTKKNYAGKLIVVEWPFRNIGQFSSALKARAGYYPAGWNPKTNTQLLQFDYRGYDNTADVMAFNNPF